MKLHSDTNSESYKKETKSLHSVNEKQIDKYRANLTTSQNNTENKPTNGRAIISSGHNKTNSKPEPSVSAGLACAPVLPPTCNTGGRYSNNLSFSDWLRATTGDDEYFQNFVFDLLKLFDSLSVTLERSEKGMIGYSIKDSIMYGSGDERLLLGNLATGNHNNEGGLFELNGHGCELFRLHYPEKWEEIYFLLVEYKFRFTRLDTALDFYADYALEKGYTVPNLTYAALESELLNKDTQKGQQALKVNNVGSWGELMCKNVSAFTYDPLEHAQEGLTSYFGNRKSSPDYFRFYEKGKQLDPNLPEGVEDRAYFRIEQEMKNPAKNRVIPLEAMLKPDCYFGEGRPNLRKLLEEMRDHYGLDGIDELHRENKKKQKVKSLTRKREWLRETGGRTFKTLLDTIPNDEREELLKNPLIAYLVRPEGLTDFIDDLDLKDYNVLDDLIMSKLVPVEPIIKNDRVPLEVKELDGVLKVVRVPINGVSYVQS
jgi:DNA relaxase NicK